MNCPVCGGGTNSLVARTRDDEYRTSDETWEYVRCTSCSVIFLRDPPVDRLGVIYPKNYYSFGQLEDSKSLLWTVKESLDRRAFRRILADVPGDDLSVLDVGGGSGYLLHQVRQADPRARSLHVVDFDAELAPAAEAAGIHFHAARIEDFEPQQQFDLILLLNLIEHVANPGLVLRKCAAMLSTGGHLVIKTPNTATLDRRIFKHRWGGFHSPRHWVLFTMEQFSELATSCGLRSVQAEYTQGAAQWTVSLLAVLTDLGWIRVSAERPMYRHPLFPVVAALAAAFDFLRAPFMPTAQMNFIFERAGAPGAEPVRAQ